MDIKFISYVGTDKFDFNTPKSDVHVLLGKPSRASKIFGSNIVKEIWFELGLHLFFEGEVLTEVTSMPSIDTDKEKRNAHFLDYDVFNMPAQYIYSELCRLDGNPIKKVGSTIFLKLGVSVYGFEEYDEKEQDDRSFGVYREGVWDDIIYSVKTS